MTLNENLVHVVVDVSCLTFPISCWNFNKIKLLKYKLKGHAVGQCTIYPQKSTNAISILIWRKLITFNNKKVIQGQDKKIKKCISHDEGALKHLWSGGRAVVPVQAKLQAL